MLLADLLPSSVWPSEALESESYEPRNFVCNGFPRVIQWKEAKLSEVVYSVILFSIEKFT